MAVDKNRGLLLQAIHEAQGQSGENFLTMAAAEGLAEDFDITREEVLDTATFYGEVSTRPRGRHIIKVCSSPCCHFSGGKEVLACLDELLHVQAGQTTEDRLFTVEKTGCIGSCDESPAMMVDERIYGNLSQDRIADIIRGFREEKDR